MKLVSKLALGLLLAGIMGSSARAQIIGLAFNATFTLDPTATYGGSAGASTGWNNNSHNALSGTGLIDSTATTTTASWTFSSNGITPQNGGTVTGISGSQDRGGATVAANGVFSGDVYSNMETIELNLTTIPYTSYSLYVYADTIGGTQSISDFVDGTQQGSTFYVGDGTLSSTYTQGTSTDPDAPAGNFVVFSGLSGASQTLDLTIDPSSGQFSLLNAIEIVNTAPIPEPGTWAMLLGGLSLLIGVRQMRRLRNS